MGFIGIAVVRGPSMLPTLREGDRLLVRYGARVRPGDLVLARFPDGVLVVKRATGRRTTSSGAGGWWLASDNPDQGVDSRHRGPVRDDAVVGVIRGRLWPWPNLLGGRRRVEHSDPP
jgi:nickel-type superoxide dismutase maturation protease